MPTLCEILHLDFFYAIRIILKPSSGSKETDYSWISLLSVSWIRSSVPAVEDAVERQGARMGRCPRRTVKDWHKTWELREGQLTLGFGRAAALWCSRNDRGRSQRLPERRAQWVWTIVSLPPLREAAAGRGTSADPNPLLPRIFVPQTWAASAAPRPGLVFTPLRRRGKLRSLLCVWAASSGSCGRSSVSRARGRDAAHALGPRGAEGLGRPGRLLPSRLLRPETGSAASDGRFLTSPFSGCSRLVRQQLLCRSETELLRDFLRRADGAASRCPRPSWAAAAARRGEAEVRAPPVPLPGRS